MNLHRTPGVLPGSGRPWNRTMRICAGVFVMLVIGVWAVVGYRQGAPRRDSLVAVAALNQALAAPDHAGLLEQIHLPVAAAGRSPAEQQQWLVAALQDELSAEGLAELRRHAQFGPLAAVFPAEAQPWAEAARVRVEDCVAFRMERDGLRAEVVLHQTPEGFRIVRCNNVRQMAPEPKS